jgi:hypothetical protein
MSAPAKAPATCDCGTPLPAAVQFLTPNFDGQSPSLTHGATLLLACGNCGVWYPWNLSPWGASRTANAFGFENMPALDRCETRGAGPIARSLAYDADPTRELRARTQALVEFRDSKPRAPYGPELDRLENRVLEAAEDWARRTVPRG